MSDLLTQGLATGSPIALLTQGLIVPFAIGTVSDRRIFIVSSEGRSFAIPSRN